MTDETIKNTLKHITNNMPDDEKEIVNKAIETIFKPTDPNFNPTIEEVNELEKGCNGEYF